MYVDIDVHHGDGVEEAFLTTDRVMTLSLHKYGDFFPGTGELRDVGVGKGKYHAVNIPLRDGMDDTSYEGIFRPVIREVMKYYQPDAVVLQCGADSLSGDRLGPFNLSMEGHASCVEFVKSFNLPMLVLGGGGYTVKNVALTWAYETGILVDEKMPKVLPFSEYYDYYGPEYELAVKPSNMPNHNSPEYLQHILGKVVEHLRCINPCPSVQMTDIPEGLGMNDDMESAMDDEDQDDNPDVRTTTYRFDKKVENSTELYESDNDDEEFGDAAYNLQMKRLAKRKAGERNRTDGIKKRERLASAFSYSSELSDSRPLLSSTDQPNATSSTPKWM